MRQWTGHEAKVLRQARRMSVRRFAAHLGVNPAAVSNWERRGTETRLRYETQEILDTDLAHASNEIRQRFEQALADDLQGERGTGGSFPAGIPVAPSLSRSVSRLGEGSGRRTLSLLETIKPGHDSRLRYVPPNGAVSSAVDFLGSPSRVFVVKGPPGSGKSRLMYHLAEQIDLADFQLISAVDWSEGSMDLAAEILRYASIPGGADPLLTLEHESAALSRPLVVVIDGPAVGKSLQEVCRQLDVILRQVLIAHLRFLLVMRTPPDLELARHPVLAASIMEPDKTDRGSSLRLDRWDLASARVAWESSRASDEPSFDELPTRVRHLARMPLYMHLIKAAGLSESPAHTNAYRLVDFCVRSIVMASGRDAPATMEQLGQLAQQEISETVVGPLTALQRPADRTALVDAPLDAAALPLLRVATGRRPTFDHDVIREYFLATSVAQMIEGRGRSSATVEIINDLAARTMTSADVHGIFEFILQYLDAKAPDLLAAVSQAPTISLTGALPLMLDLTGDGAGFATEDVLRACASRSMSDSGLPLAQALLRIPALASILGEDHPNWILQVLSRFGSPAWPNIVSHVQEHLNAREVQNLLRSAQLDDADEAVFFARYFFASFGEDCDPTGSLQALLGHTDWRVRAALAAGIAEQSTGHHITDVVIDTLVTDPDYKVRAAAAEAVGRRPLGIPHHRMSRLLLDENWHVRERFLRGIASNGTPIDDAVRAILGGEAWQHAPANVCVAAQRLLLLYSETNLADTDARRRALFGLLRETRTGHRTLTEGVQDRLVGEALRSSDWLVSREASALRDTGEPSTDLRASKERFRRLRDHRSLQIALDVPDMAHALMIAEAAASAGVHFIEVGDPLIKSVGTGAIKQIKHEAPQVNVVAELMSADWGRDQVEIAAEAGADVVLLIGPASIASVSAAVEASRRLAVPLVLDVPQGRLDLQWVQTMEGVGIDGFAITTNIDLGIANLHPLDQARTLRTWTRLPVAVSGGFGSTDDAVRQSRCWDILVVGRAVTDATNPAAAARQLASLVTTTPQRSVS
ncbi:orotidine 5'-phosphate decarboxylase / HUMPS family protein [Krasilnikovia cinnamomea]|uniref:orotidine 5'-phosphate decarboxylase / HUMPS family protein n=1 Tax=Krasilnikovia cinnamomea TaxID=349313 RepID=UPI001F5F7B6C|nr:orotidine 5'-phosphate decarboxylase / HUMPS family protein [Krasilnikovia cinnamomea]